MKKLLILLFSILISFNSFAGGIEGKGLVCEGQSTYTVMEPKFYWFENGKINPVRIEGYDFFWDNTLIEYKEEGTQKILFWDNINSSTSLISIDRVTLVLKLNTASPNMFCSPVSSKEEMNLQIQKIIDSAKKTNKI
jgi:hypothetical protein